MTLSEFNSKYIYVSDRNKFDANDIWEVIKPDSDGYYRGDCESYALTLRKLIPVYKDWELYYCKLNGNGHCLLHKDGLVIDCNIKKPITLLEYQSCFIVTDYMKYNWFIVYSKLLYTKLFKLKKAITIFLRNSF